LAAELQTKFLHLLIQNNIEGNTAMSIVTVVYSSILLSMLYVTGDKIVADTSDKAYKRLNNRRVR